MKSFQKDVRRLVAEFLANLGVAWYAAGVIGVFVGNAQTAKDIAFSLMWGAGLSVVSLLAAIRVLKGSKV